MKRFVVGILSVFLFVNFGYACSMYKITINGRTIVGNNEDWFNPNSQIWFDPKGEHLYGVMNVGFDDKFAQGGINEAGLMFDGFAMPYLEVKNTEGKKKIDISELTAPIMHRYETVQQVRNYLLGIDLSFMVDGMVVFIDKSGDYLIVEGDELILGNDAEQSFSNFYPSQCNSLDEVQIPFFQSGLAYTKSTEATTTLDYCSAVMDAMQQDITLYTSIYDLENGIVRIYHHHNFKDFIELDLKEEFKKGAHTLIIPELFSKDTEGYKFYEMYKDPVAMKSYYEASIKEKAEMYFGGDYKELPEQAKDAIIDVIKLQAGIWGESNKDYQGEISILNINTEFYPNNYKGYDIIGDVYLENKEYSFAEDYYKKSIVLNSDNDHAKQKLDEIESLQN